MRLILISLLFLCFNQAFYAQVTADFTADKTEGCGSLAGVQFSDQSSGNITSWSWSFGNGNSSTIQNPTASYTNINSYTVKLVVSNGTDVDSITKVAYINVYQGPSADFTFSPNVGCSPLPVNFSSTSTQGGSNIVTYIWDYGDGSQPGSGSNPSHTYSSGGSKSPSLEVIDQNGCKDTEVKSAAINVTQAPIAAFSTSNSAVSCSAPYTVNFQNNSSGANLTYQWDFGDGSTSTQENPSHNYTTLGKYDIRLIVSDPNCSDTIYIADFIRLENPNASFSLPKSYYCLGDTLKPTNNSTGTNTHIWSFGSRNSNQKNPQIVLQDSGFIAIKLIASSNPSCIDIAHDTIYVEEFIADFTTDTTLSCLKDPTVFTATSNFPATYIWSVQISELEFDILNTNPDTLIPPVSGTFSDTLFAVSSSGCLDTVFKPDNRKVARLEPSIRMVNQSTLEDNELLKGCLPISRDFEDNSTGDFPIVSWNWDFDDNRLSTLEKPGIYNFTVRKPYGIDLKIRDSLGCEAEMTAFISGGRKRTPGFSISPDSLCVGDTFTLVNQSSPDSLITAYKVDFINFDSLNNFASYKGSSTGIIDTIRDNLYGNYYINYTVSDNGCDSTAAKTDSIYVKGPNAFPRFFSNCQSNLIVEFKGNMYGTSRFYWDFGDSSAIDSVNVNPVHTYSQNGLYRVKLLLINDTSGCDTARITFDVPLFSLGLNFTPDSMQFCLGDTFNYFISDTSYYPDVEWFLNDQKVSSQDTLQLKFDTIGKTMIKLRATDAFGCTDSIIDSIYVSQPQALFGSYFIDSCAPIEVAFFDSSITDTIVTKWEWKFGNNQTSSQKRDTITFSPNSNSDIFFKIENKFGCKDSILVQDYLDTKPLDVSFREVSTNICSGDSVRFRNTTNGLNPSFIWDFGDGDSSLSSNEYLYHTFDSAGTFTVSLTAKDKNGCIITVSKNNLVTVDSIPTAEFSADTLQAPCPSLEVNFEDQSIGGVSQWKWIISSSNDTFEVQNPYKNFTQPGNYNVSLAVSTPNGCKDTIIKPNFIKVGGPSGQFEINKTEACVNEVLRFEVTDSSGGVNNFIWDFGDGFTADSTVAFHAYDTTGKIYPSLILDDTNGCSLAIRDSINIYNIYADFILEDDSVCQPFETIFTNTSEGANSYEWLFGDGASSQATEPSHSYPNSGNYKIELRVTSNRGCLDTATKFLEVLPRVIAQLQADTTICVGDSITLNSSGGSSYQWSPDSILNDTFGSSVLAFPDSTSIINLIANNAVNCPDTTSMKIEVQQPPELAQLQDTSLIIGEEISYTVNAGEGFQYLWSPKEGVDCGTCPNPTFSPLITTPYTLQVFDPSGCFNITRKVLIEIIEKYSLDVPSAFSPNGDGVNDIIYARGWGLKELKSFKIYNRFGELVFESQDFDKGWDGTYRGKDQNIETYVYTVEALTFGGKTLTKKGNISLIR